MASQEVDELLKDETVRLWYAARHRPVRLVRAPIPGLTSPLRPSPFAGGAGPVALDPKLVTESVRWPSRAIPPHRPMT